MALRAGNYISLASGGGGLDLGVDLGAGGTALPVLYVENEATAAALLVHRMETAHLPAAPLWSDLRTFDFRAWRGLVDGIVGGYPCQPFSYASGAPKGERDRRHLWPFIAAGVASVVPRWCFFENVAGHLSLGGHEVARSLQELGYEVAAVLLSARVVGSPQGRERLFILAVADADGGGRGPEPGVEYPQRAEISHRSSRGSAFPPLFGDTRAWAGVLTEGLPFVCREPDGLARGLDLSRSDRLRILGNGVVPQQAAYAWRLLWREFGIEWPRGC